MSVCLLCVAAKRQLVRFNQRLLAHVERLSITIYLSIYILGLRMDGWRIRKPFLPVHSVVTQCNVQQEFNATADCYSDKRFIVTVCS